MDPPEAGPRICKLYRLLKLGSILATFATALQIFLMQMLKYYYTGSNTLK
jgi:hypothetical protein